VVNVVAGEVAELERPKAKPKPSPPPAASGALPSRRTRERAVAELRTVVPPGHSFGRRGR
jgi:hypothetical protein